MWVGGGTDVEARAPPPRPSPTRGEEDRQGPWDLRGAGAHHGLAEPDRPVRLVLPRHGGHRLHPALPPALPGPAGDDRSDDRPGLDPGGPFGAGPVPDRALVRSPGMAEAVPGGRAGGPGALDRP